MDQRYIFYISFWYLHNDLKRVRAVCGWKYKLSSIFLSSWGERKKIYIQTKLSIIFYLFWVVIVSFFYFLNLFVLCFSIWMMIWKYVEKKYFNVKKKIEKSIMFFFEANSNIKKKIVWRCRKKINGAFFVCWMLYSIL